MIIPFLIRRFWLPREGGVLSTSLWISVFGVVLGIVLLMLVLSVMTGFLEFLENRYTRITSQIVVIPRRDAKGVRKRVQELGFIEAATPMNLGQGLIVKEGFHGASLEGVEWESSQQVTPWNDVWVKQPSPESSLIKNWIWLGNHLAEKIQAEVGDTVDVLVPSPSQSNDGQRVEPFIVTGITRFGMYEHDLRYARIPLEKLNELFGLNQREPMLKIKLKPGVSVDRAVRDLEKYFGREVNVRPWNEIHQNMFLAVQDQKQRLFWVLEIIVLLSAVNVINLLLMSAYYRRKDIAILQAMGLKKRQVFKFFLSQGALVGVLGVGVGIGTGCVVCRFAERFQPEILSESIYNVTKLPFKIVVGDIVLIAVVSFALCLLLSLIPAVKAMKKQPVEALRYE